MQLRFTKGVGIALAIAAGCAVLGFLMAPGWWFFAAFSAWWALSLALRTNDQSRYGALCIDSPSRSDPESVVMSDFVNGTDPILRHQASNVYIDWDANR